MRTGIEIVLAFVCAVATFAQSIGEIRFGSIDPDSVSSIVIESYLDPSGAVSRTSNKPAEIRALVTFLRETPYRIWMPAFGPRRSEGAIFKIRLTGRQDEVCYYPASQVTIGKTTYMVLPGTVGRVDSLFRSIGN